MSLKELNPKAAELGSALRQYGVGPSWVPGGRPGPSSVRGGRGAICLLPSSTFVVQCRPSFTGSSAMPVRLACAITEPASSATPVRFARAITEPAYCCLLLCSTFIVQCRPSFSGLSDTPARLACAQNLFCGLKQRTGDCVAVGPGAL